MINPATFDISIQQNASFDLVFQFKNNVGVAIDMTGYTVLAQLWTASKGKKICDFTTTWLNRSTGIVKLSIPYVSTSEIGNDGVWDVLVTNPDGTRDYWVRGNATLVLGYTE
jgi:hypothetical protein